MKAIKRFIERDIILCFMLRTLLSALSRLHFRLFCYVAEGLSAVDAVEELTIYHGFVKEAEDQAALLSKKRVSHLIEIIQDQLTAMSWLIEIQRKGALVRSIECHVCGDHNPILSNEDGEEGWYRCHCGMLHRPLS